MAAIKPKRKNVSQENMRSQQEVSKDNSIKIEIDKILSPKYHDRKYIDRSTIVELAESIKSEGLITPIVVRELKDGSLERIIGYRRIEAFKILGKKQIPAIVLKNISDKQAILMMATENLQRENISVYDETLTLLDYIAVALGTDAQNVIKILTRFKNYNAHNIKELNNADLKKYDEVSMLLEKTGKITINTLVDRLNMLNVNALLKEELSAGTLSYSNAKILNKITDDKLLSEAIKEVIKNGYSKRETLSYVKTLINNKKEEAVDTSIKTNLAKLSKINIKKLQKKDIDKINELIEEIIKIARWF